MNRDLLSSCTQLAHKKINLYRIYTLYLPYRYTDTYIIWLELNKPKRDGLGKRARTQENQRPSRSLIRQSMYSLGYTRRYVSSGLVFETD